MKILVGLVVFSFSLCGQSIVDLLSLQKIVTTSGSTTLTVTAAQGDGSSCSFSKNNGGSITGVFACSSADGKTTIKTATLRSNASSTNVFPIGLGDVLCLIGVNPTGSASVMGSLGSIPANSIMWNCSTNVRDTQGNITGQTAIVAGTTSWP